MRPDQIRCGASLTVSLSTLGFRRRGAWFAMSEALVRPDPVANHDFDFFRFGKPPGLAAGKQAKLL